MAEMGVESTLQQQTIYPNNVDGQEFVYKSNPKDWREKNWGREKEQYNRFYSKPILPTNSYVNRQDPCRRAASARARAVEAS